MKESSQQEAEQTHESELLTGQLRRKEELSEAGRARLLAVRKASMVRRTGNPTFAEQRKKVNQYARLQLEAYLRD